jgi:hypothetical protein
MRSNSRQYFHAYMAVWGRKRHRVYQNGRENLVIRAKRCRGIIHILISVFLEGKNIKVGCIEKKQGEADTRWVKSRY